MEYLIRAKCLSLPLDRIAARSVIYGKGSRHRHQIGQIAVLGQRENKSVSVPDGQHGLHDPADKAFPRPKRVRFDVHEAAQLAPFSHIPLRRVAHQINGG